MVSWPWTRGADAARVGAVRHRAGDGVYDIVVDDKVDVGALGAEGIVAG